MKRNQKEAVACGVVLLVLGAAQAFAGTFVASAGIAALPELPVATIQVKLPSAIPAVPVSLPSKAPAMRVQLSPVVALGQVSRQAADKAAAQPALGKFFDNVAGIPVPSPIAVDGKPARHSSVGRL